MRLTKSNINLLLIIAGVLIGVCAWLYGATPLQEKTQALETENISLKTQVDMYQAVNANLNTYKAEMEEMKASITEIGNFYPVNITREDEIMFLAKMEDAFPNDILVGSIKMGAFAEVYSEHAGAAVEGANIVNMYKQPTTYDFISTYDGLKEMIIYLSENANKKGIEQIEVLRDSETGNLRGSMILNQFYMSGLDKEYQPIAIPSVQKGVTDVFHTVKSAGGVKATVNPETVEETEETEESEE